MKLGVQTHVSFYKNCAVHSSFAPTEQQLHGRFYSHHLLHSLMPNAFSPDIMLSYQI